MIILSTCYLNIHHHSWSSNYFSITLFWCLLSACIGLLIIPHSLCFMSASAPLLRVFYTQQRLELRVSSWIFAAAILYTLQLQVPIWGNPPCLCNSLEELGISMFWDANAGQTTGYITHFLLIKFAWKYRHSLPSAHMSIHLFSECVVLVLLLTILTTLLISFESLCFLQCSSISEGK